MAKKRRSREQGKPRQIAGRAAFELETQRKWILGLILVVTFLTFANSLFNAFAYDDTTQILQNEFIRDFRNLPKAMVTETWYWRVQQDKDPNKQDKPSTPYYRPIFVIYLMIMWKLFGASAFGWHLFNIALHLTVVYLVFLVLERITKDIRVSGIACLIFAVHPMRSESVAWISGLTDPLLAIFVLSSFHFYLRYREERLAKLLLASLGLFLLAAFTKEPAVALPIFIAAYELFVINQDKSLYERIKPALAYPAPYLFLSGLYFIARYFALGFALNNNAYVAYPLYQIALTIPLAIWKYLGLLMWPLDLSLFHATRMVKSPVDVRFLLPLAGMVPLVLGLWRLRHLMLARFAILWFAINLLPVLNLSAFSEDFLVQERYVYIPSIGFSLLLAMALVKIPIRLFTPKGKIAGGEYALAFLTLTLMAIATYVSGSAKIAIVILAVGFSVLVAMWFAKVPIRLFASKGRIGRAEYALAFLTLILMTLAIYLSGSMHQWMAVAIWAVGVVIYLRHVAKRLHDLGDSGYWLLLQFVPIVSFIQTVVLMARRGNRGSNAYGDDPSGTVLVSRLRLLMATTAGVLLIGLAALFPFKSLAQNTNWKDDMTVWFHGVETAPDQPISHFVLGHKLINFNQFSKSAEQLEEYLKLKSDNPIVIGNLAADYVLIYQYQASVNPNGADRASLDRALALCEQGIKLTPEVSSLWDTLGQIYTFETGLKNYDRALACLQRGLMLDPSNAMVSFHIGGTLVKKGNFDDGIPFLKTTIEHQPQIVDAHKFLAYAYKGKGQLREAVDELSLYLQLQPNAPDYARVSKDVQDLRAQLQTPSPQG